MAGDEVDAFALFGAAGLASRTYQVKLANAVANDLRPGAPIVLAVQAATGVGKTWAVAVAAMEAALRGRRVVWSTHTVLLRAQVLATLEKAAMAVDTLRGTRPSVAQRRGMGDFVSRSRTLRLRHGLKDRGADQETLDLLDRLAGWAATIPDFVAAHGELPVPQSLVCLRASCPEEERAGYASHVGTAAAASIVVQTHAMTLLEARFRRLAGDLVIFDEADTIPSTAASAVEMRLPLADLRDLCAAAGIDAERDLAAMEARLSADPEAIAWRDEEIARSATAIAEGLRGGAAASADPILAEALRDTATDLSEFASVDAPKTGAALLRGAGGEALAAVAAVDAAGWLGRVLEDRQVVLLSATLGRHEEDDLAAACRRFGMHHVRQLSISPERFGTMRLRLADRKAPEPKAGDDGAPFIAYGAQVIREAAGTGRTLVLTPSYGDIDLLAPALPAEAILHRRGEALGPLVQRFVSDPRAILVTPAAWAGLDLPGIIDNLVLLRLPNPPPDRLREAVLAKALERRGMSAEDARNILFNDARGESLRRLAQGIGRGIRSDSDQCTIWIADPRFPLPAAWVRDLRRRLTQGPASGWQEMAKAIPRRFRAGGPASAFEQARIVPVRAASAAA
jgi:ATP-dependent DNA helicase DinG